MPTIQIRINEKRKKNMQKVIKKSGMTISGAMNLYINQIISTEHIPFQISPSIELEKMVMEAHREYKEGKTKKFTDPKKLMEYLHDRW
ncbi:MAG: hypothetical protein G01um101418_861 [Parcubacteria group bacterium Gr01-1014_18]|nr:MAG: hypothetical protein Greene041636_821 [Parcubacteria group bacterium Greene0416_36]TSC79862.1 MAG: hypothetical protein G01um101418_861 [Parcubacteria group bacterium Gr01-1014_18]TSC98294.1 MAG: hypothetical protein Greene101420_798 [Parcubacteria group bacterium Greene1014_20]TSD06665.1 MAG: hypothetical protein Greene07142_717 [Parcubacteria group bacterium Greene0714_2]